MERDTMRQEANYWVDADLSTLAKIRAFDAVPLSERQLEEAIYSPPDVLEAAVVAAPDEKSGEVPYAYIALKAFANSTAEQVLAQSADFIPERAAIPKACYVLPTLPKTAVGKVQKNVLRVDAAERVMRAALERAELSAVAHLRVEDRGASGIVCVVELDALPSQIAEETSQTVRAVLGVFPIQLLILPASARKKSPRN
ncbi:hypothetical protein CF70_024120 [Cupriavidus sp. SK-3]|nr:hypothetical protein CF70_024120 [Cupriavidus sp. SK-3]